MRPWWADPWTSGDRFRKARERTGLDQEPFAELIGSSRQTVSNYEKDNTQRHVQAIVNAWALATGTTPEWLLEGLPHLDSNQKPIGYQSAAGQLILPFQPRGGGITTPMREQLADVIDLDARRAVA